MQELPLQVWLYRPGEITVGDTGQRGTAPYTKIYAKARLMSATARLGATGDVILPADQRRYVIRHMSGIDTRWLLEDDNGEIFGVLGTAPMPGERRKGHLVLTVEYSSDQTILEADDG